MVSACLTSLESGLPYWASFIFTDVNRPLDFLHGNHLMEVAVVLPTFVPILYHGF